MKNTKKQEKPPLHLFLPIDTIDVNDGNHFTEANNQKGNGTGKVVKKSKPVVSRACGENEAQCKGYQTGQPWKKLQKHKLSSKFVILEKYYKTFFFLFFGRTL